MIQKNIQIMIATILVLVLTLNLISAISVDADYTTVYPGDSGKVTIKVDNNENFDIEDVSLALNLDDTGFTAVGSSEKDLDDINDRDDDSVSFTLRASTDIVPGDYNIPYTLKYVNADDANSTVLEKSGSFGIRVSAKTDLDFVVETNENAIVGNDGQITLEIINRGLGEIKSVSVEVFPQGYQLLSKSKIFVGTIDSDDSDTATFDVYYSTSSPLLSAKITYKDFDNNDQTETISLPVKVYTKEQALNLGLIQKPSYTIYVVIGILVVGFVIYRIRKKKKRKSLRG